MRVVRIALIAFAALAATVVGKAHRCKLRKRGLAVQQPLPTSPATNAPTPTGAPQPSATGGSSSSPGPLPLFNYSTTPIRGVNLGASRN